ncbi:YbaK/EbsC family protein [Campylobacter concisus]|uniref:YbaK/EbsC family protein n=1 Tax=Campylobacter concisus TaxID=199 RepID=UPI000CD8205A|nr:YbaK/EbsC family protein [Campylobacter concisus]
MSEQIFNKIHDLLSKNGAKFRVIEHESARTSEEVAKIRGTKMSQGAKALVCSVKGANEEKFRQIFKDENMLEGYLLDDEKPVMKAGKIYLVAILPADKQADLDALSQKFDGKKASLASPEEVTALADCVFGSVPPFSFHKNLHLVVDESLLERNEEIAFNAGLLDRSIVLNAKDYARMVKPVLVKFVK